MVLGSEQDHHMRDWDATIIMLALEIFFCFQGISKRGTECILLTDGIYDCPSFDLCHKHTRLVLTFLCCCSKLVGDNKTDKIQNQLEVVHKSNRIDLRFRWHWVVGVLLKTRT